VLSRVKFVIGAFFVIGLMTLLVHTKEYPKRTEEWMEQAVPEQLQGYTLAAASSKDPAAKMDERTYAILQPFGIVTRKFQKEQDGRSYDFVVIAGNTRKPFHDPVICFSAQNWVLRDRHLKRVNIPTLGGKIPATVMSLDQPGVHGTAMYFYKDPFGWRHSPLYIPFDLTAAKLMLWDKADAQFYRLIVWPATPPEDDTPQAARKAQEHDIAMLEKFADAMFAKLNQTEDGRYFVEK
jgi:hypothetical protein